MMTVNGKKYHMDGEPITCAQGSVNYALKGPRGAGYMFWIMADGRAFIMNLGGMPRRTNVDSWSK